MSGCSIASVPASVRRVIILQVVRNLYPKRRIRPWLARARGLAVKEFAGLCAANALQPTKVCQRPKAGCHEFIRNASTSDSMFWESPQTLEQSAQASAPSTIASGTSFVPQDDSTVRSSFQCNIIPKNFCTCFLGAPFVISMSNVDFIQQRLD